MRFDDYKCLMSKHLGSGMYKTGVTSKSATATALYDAIKIRNFLNAHVVTGNNGNNISLDFFFNISDYQFTKPFDK